MCSVLDCTSPVLAKKMCALHYRRTKNTGTPYSITVLKWSTCRECGQDFLAPAVGVLRTLCGPRCRRTARNERSRRWAQDNPERFREQQTRSYQKYRDARAEYVRQWSIENPDRRYAAKQKRRQVEKSAVEIIDRLKVFDRDQWTCRLCGEPVQATLRFPDPLSASLDHVIPLAVGGSHTYKNVSLAHLLCNIRKGAREPNLAKVE